MLLAMITVTVLLRKLFIVISAFSELTVSLCKLILELLYSYFLVICMAHSVNFVFFCLYLNFCVLFLGAKHSS